MIKEEKGGGEDHQIPELSASKSGPIGVILLGCEHEPNEERVMPGPLHVIGEQLDLLLALFSGEGWAI